MGRGWQTLWPLASIKDHLIAAAYLCIVTDHVPGSLSQRAPLGCDGKGDLNPRYAANQLRIEIVLKAKGTLTCY